MRRVNHLDIMHECSSHNRIYLDGSAAAACFSCFAIFDPATIKEWVNKDAQTALCPHCGIDAVLPGDSFAPSDIHALHAMYERYFLHSYDAHLVGRSFTVCSACGATDHGEGDGDG